MRYVLAALVVCVLGFGAWFLTRSDAPAPAPEAVSVTAAAPETPAAPEPVAAAPAETPAQMPAPPAGMMSETDVLASLNAARQAQAAGLQLSSPAFAAEGAIPARFTCKGEDISPALAWSGAPQGTQSFALIVTDPDAVSEKPFLHWLAYDIPADSTGLPEKTGPAATAIVQGMNDKGAAGYAGPCPPDGTGSHRYYFRLYALDAPTGLAPGASLAQLEAVLAQHVLDQAVLMGRFGQ